MCSKYRLKYIPVNSFIRDVATGAVYNMRTKCVNETYCCMAEVKGQRERREGRINSRSCTTGAGLIVIMVK